MRAAVHQAVEELLAERGPEAMTIPAVAERAGVHATTIYRRWGSIAGLLSSVAVSRLTGDLVVPHSGSLRSDLAQWVRDVISDTSDPDALLMLRTVVGATRDGSGRSACMADRHTQLEAILEADRARGNEPRDAEQLLDTLLGPIYLRALFDDAPLPDERVEPLVDLALGCS